MKIIIKISKFLHKWIGLFLFIYISYMSITGILLNHPEFFSGIDAPRAITPKQYDFGNWNRSSLISVLKGDSSEFIIGFNGIYEIDSKGATKSIMSKPFPESAWNMKTKSAILTNIESQKMIIAGTFDGIYSYNLTNKKWQKSALNGESKKIMKIIEAQDTIYAFSESEMYVSAKDKLNFKSVRLCKLNKEDSFSALEYFFELHSGEFLGHFGKILYDIVGIIAVFLSISAFYIWFYPKKRKFESKRNKLHSLKQLKIFQIFNKYHLKLGIWVFAILSIMALTGIFMRPPLIMYILSGKIPNHYHIGISKESDFSGKIRNVMYHPIAKVFIFDTKDGVYAQNAQHSPHLVDVFLPVPIFAMGATVFEADTLGNMFVGSFAGLYKIDGQSGRVEDVTSGNLRQGQSIGRPSENLITGYFTGDDGTKYISTHFSGIRALDGELNPKYSMPKEIAENLNLSLWNYAFELHNGRFFADWIGNLYILIVPLGGILFLFVICSGVIDWLWRKRRKIFQKVK